ncbi:hypothetical protein GQX74_000135 [Glossina fuscipes]|nr:hypothetical protein GQX74_000135 [Glossina fuscipes]
MLMETRGMLKSDNLKSHNREWSDIDFVEQCFLFFFADFETAAPVNQNGHHTFKIVHIPKAESRYPSYYNNSSPSAASCPLKGISSHSEAQMLLISLSKVIAIVKPLCGTYNLLAQQQQQQILQTLAAQQQQQHTQYSTYIL